MSYESGRSSSSSESTRPPTLKEEPNGKIAWEESVKKSRENNENDSTLLSRKLGETRKAIETGGSSRNKLSAVTPLKKWLTRGRIRYNHRSLPWVLLILCLI
ncbi:BAH_G0016140.mRNA.1.CDS.1 [Saccharomyces cerevisiae]|nr:BAH_G0016140.mRNA.1.CDS.1 [Saccharomyces cerevisiae]CAI7110986.1 BAH_G0016140.mRNA.1.CDS.1 [Saccharomyces cerevisiae]